VPHALDANIADIKWTISCPTRIAGAAQERKVARLVSSEMVVPLAIELGMGDLAWHGISNLVICSGSQRAG